MPSVTLDFVANVTKEQMDSTQKIKMVAFHSPFGLGSPKRCRALHHGLSNLILLLLYKAACPYRGKENEEQVMLKDVNWIS